MSKGKHLNQFQHVLERPDAYIGSIVTTEQVIPSWNGRSIEPTKMKHNYGMFKTIEEILSNAIDNNWRSMKANTPMSFIKIETNSETEEISISNDGAAIPIDLTEYEYTDPVTQEITANKLYPAELFFGYMLSGTNYDDTEERKTSGRNGMGAKATIIFSTYAKVEHVTDGKKFVQIFEDNITKRSKPKITSSKSSNYTKITFKLDFDRFGYPGIDNDLINLIHKTAYDISMITNIPVYFNKTKISIPDLTKYAKLYMNTKDMIHIKTKDCEVVLIDYTDDKYNDDFYEERGKGDIASVSFVNGCYTKDGGIHVDVWKDAIISAFVRKFNAKKKIKTTARDVYPYLGLFIRCELDKPSFDSQTKDKLNAPKPKTVKISEEITDKMLKWKCINNLIEKLEMKSAHKLEVKEKKTTTRKVFGDKADDANNAGGVNSSKCILYITEGLSAKTFVISGRSAIKDGHDFIGAMALKGKFLNVRNASKTKILENTEVTLLKDILGLRIGVDYTKDSNFKTLRYGKVNILTDADDDGIHIRGLILNFFYHMYPSLIERGGFIEALSTFVAVATKGKKREVFYSNPEYKSWETSNTDKGVSVKYYKGLGTSQAKDAKECFLNPKNVVFSTDGDEEEMMAIGFDENLSDDRKKWICSENNNNPFIYEGNLSISKFVDEQLIIYHRMCISRAIPSLVDGFKESQRKVFFGVVHKKLKKSMDLERLAGSVKETTGYHHGGTSLQEAIIKMAQGYVGSNNIPLLETDGQFGSRLRGGEDHAAPRYISTKLEKVAESIFSSMDEPILDYRMEDNISVEPTFFVPIIPMILVNGADGIGSGFSTKAPCYNPVDLIRWIKTWLKKREDINKLDKLKPYYRGYTGEITLKGSKWKSYGKLEKIPNRKNWWRVTELPIGVWTVNFKLFLEKLISEKKKKNTVMEFKEYNTENTVNFEFKCSNDFIPDMKNLNILTKERGLTNMWFIDETGYPCKFETPEEVLHKFCPIRLKYYQKRKEYYISIWNTDLVKADNRYKFIQKVMKKEIDLYKDDDELEKVLEQFEKVDDSHDYLLNIQMRSMTKKRLTSLEEEIESIKNNIEKMTNSKVEDIWIDDLKKFFTEYEKFVKTRKGNN